MFSTLSFNPCDLEKCINVQIMDDDRVERDESFKIFLEWDSAHDSILDPNSAQGTITIQDSDGEYSYTSTYRIVTDLHFCSGCGGPGEDILPSIREYYRWNRYLCHCEGILC